MAEIVLVRNAQAITDDDAQAARRVLFGAIDGLGPRNQSSWRRWWNWWLKKAEPGECAEIVTHRERLGWYHRKHMALESTVFQHQERFESFEQFRAWLKVGAGFCDWVPGPKGAIIPVPRSISYASIGQDDMERVHGDIVEFLRTEHAQKVLWPHLAPLVRDTMLNSILSEFNE